MTPRRRDREVGLALGLLGVLGEPVGAWTLVAAVAVLTCVAVAPRAA